MHFYSKYIVLIRLLGRLTGAKQPKYIHTQSFEILKRM
jgi:hypothetical protein